MIDTIEKNKCTGCKMCGDICPTQAINYCEDEQGFWYPKVDADKCVKCGLCVHRCPSLNEQWNKKENFTKVYKAWSLDENTRLSSTSGGIFYEIGKRFIEKGGVIAGCAYTDDYKGAKHILIEDIEGLKKIKGSKYFQSDTADIYEKVKDKLENGAEVLFCGTPCHMAAMRAYLGKEYENIYYMDFICRSINSPLAFKKYLEELEDNYGSKVSEVQLKNKKYGWHSLATRVKFENGQESIRDKNEDWWVKGFIYNDLYTRESCYDCKYKVLPRMNADVSIGDFWGVKNCDAEENFKGISIIIVNSLKGDKIIEEINDRIFIKESSIEAALPGNPALLSNPNKTDKQEKFFKYLKQEKFSIAVKKCTQPLKIKKILSLGKRILRKIKYIIVNPENISWTKYIYWNYISKCIIREGNVKIIPHKNAIIQIDKTARIFLEGRNLCVGINKLKHSKAETHIRIEKNAIWRCNNGCELFYNTVLEIKPDAEFKSGYFTANGGSVIIVHRKTTFGEDVMLGRNIIVYDSDFHQVLDDKDQITNYPKEVTIEDHVWLTSNVTVLKGVTIGKNSLVTAQTLIRKDVPPNSIVGGGASGKVISNTVNWSRDSVL